MSHNPGLGVLTGRHRPRSVATALPAVDDHGRHKDRLGILWGVWSYGIRLSAYSGCLVGVPPPSSSHDGDLVGDAGSTI